MAKAHHFPSIYSRLSTLVYQSNASLSVQRYVCNVMWHKDLLRDTDVLIVYGVMPFGSLYVHIILW